MADDDAFAAVRARLLAEIAAEAEATAGYTGRAAFSPAVMAAIAGVPRHLFVPDSQRAAAYDNRPLPIGFGQTISQPYIVAVMTDLLDLAPTDRALEIGTGCGYQTAVLARLAGFVWSIEVVPELAARARARLERLGAANVALRCGDGFAGWPDAAPFDAVIATAAPRELPPALVEQLAPGGRLVIPIGPPGGPQSLLRCVKRPSGELAVEDKLPVAFVPMVKG